MDPTWLGPASTVWQVDDSSTQPFVRYRALSGSHRAAIDANWSDQRYVEAVLELDAAVTRVGGQGFTITPTTEQPGLAAAIGHSGELIVKDETNNVSGSHKARHLFGLALHLAISDESQGRLAISSCGNAALAAATIAAAAHREIDVFVPVWADAGVVEDLRSLGASVQHCERRPGEEGDPCFLRFREAMLRGAVPFGCQGPVDPRTLDGGRTLGWEIAEQVGNFDRLVIQVGGGALASSLSQGLWDAARLEQISAMPRIDTVQTEGCAPLAAAMETLAHEHGDIPAAASNPEHYMKPWPNEPASAADGILDDITYDWLVLAWAMQATGGQAIVATETRVLAAHESGRITGIHASATGTAGLAGLLESPEPGRTLLVFTGVDR
jgi:threonine synthase